MGLARIELLGRLLKAPTLRVTPSGRAVLRLSVDCGEEAAPLTLETLVLDEPARSLARSLSVGQWIRVAGSLRAVRHGALAGSVHQQIEVVASEVYTEPEREIGKQDESTASRALSSAKV